jgi:hypothetical protein
MQAIRDQSMQVPHNIRMHLTGYSGLRPLPLAGDAGRSATRESQRVSQSVVVDFLVRP